MFVSTIKEDDLSVDIIDKLLYAGLEDTGENADCIIVLGSSKAAKYRIPVAVAAYKAGRANKVLLCGGKLRDFPSGNLCEAEHMYQAAVDLGVSEDDIILEKSSQNTVENILFALTELQKAFSLNNINKVILVTTTYHMKRSMAIARYLIPKHISIIPCPADDTNTKRDNWMQSSVGIERAKKEAAKLIKYVINGVIPDFEIPD